MTSYTFDAAGRLTSETDPRSQAITYTYDAANHLTQVQDRNGRRRAFDFDAAGRQTAERWLDGQGATIRTTSYGYDNANKLTSASDPSATYAIAYDADDRLTSVNNTGTPGMPQITLSFTYDTRDNRTRLNDNRNGQVDYVYNLADRVTSEQMSVIGLSNRPKVTFGYDTAARLTSLGRTNNTGGSGGGTAVNSTFAYDTASRVTGITHTGYGTLASYAFTWDNANQLTQEVSNDGTVNFSYDLRGQLTGATGWRTENYTFDALGNRTALGAGL